MTNRKMKIKTFLCLTLFALVLLCMFFSYPFLIKNHSAEASIHGVSGNKFVITGFVGNNPQHYFTNNNDQSTLINAEVYDGGESHYSIRQSALPVEDYVYGVAEFLTPMDMKKLMEKGVVYVQGSCKFKSKKDNDASKIQLTVSSNGEEQHTLSTESLQDDGTLKTPLLKVTDIENPIKFEFKSIGKVNSGNKASFEMHMPTLRFFTSIDKVSLDNENQNVSPGQVIPIKAHNDVTDINNISGNFLAYSKVNHKIMYNFISGEEYVNIVGEKMYLSNNIPDNTVIRFSAYSKKTSYSTELIYSKEVVFTVKAGQVNVKVLTDFDSCATIRGEGEYLVNERITLSARAKAGYTFDGWYLNGQELSKKSKIVYIVNVGDEIYAKFIKTVSIKSITVPSKIYDGTTTVDNNDIAYDFEGKQAEHELLLIDGKFAYTGPDAGKNKKVVCQNPEELKFSGKNSDIYRLDSIIIPDINSTILPREITVEVNNSSKQYGDIDPVFDYKVKNIVKDESLRGTIGRSKGETIGDYSFNVDSLSNLNPNYKIKMIKNDNKFTIKQRNLSIKNIYVQDKIYDGNQEATIISVLSNIYNNEDVTLSVEGKFDSKEVGTNKLVSITSHSLNGADKDNYNLSITKLTLYGNITPKDVFVQANKVNCVYGDPISLSYTATGLIGEDKLEGELSVDDNVVGIYEIRLNNLSNPNYVVHFTSDKCVITERELTVSANKITKNYADLDPILSYSTTNLVNDDTLQGSLVRMKGENIGEYEILIGNLTNINYNITFISNTFEILPRQISVNIDFKDKVYDGKNDIEYSVGFVNNIKQENFELLVDASFNNVNCGRQKISVSNTKINGTNLTNYTFNYILLNIEANIKRRNITVEIDNKYEKTYGEIDPQLSYKVTNLVPNDILFGNVARNIGENVGQYSYYLNTLNNDNNPNYDIKLQYNDEFTIKPKKLLIYTQDTEKTYGDEDPLFNMKMVDPSQLCFDDNEKDILNGLLKRTDGEIVGVYNYIVDSVSTSKNYIFEIKQDNVFVITKRKVMVQCDDATKIYGEEDPIYTFEVSNKLPNDTLTVDIKREYGEDVGEYQLFCANNNDSRYNIVFIPGYLNILPTSISLRADAKVKIYGEEDPTFTVMIVDGVLNNNDMLSSIQSGEMVREKGEDIGKYAISQGSYSLGKNYNIVFETNNLEILQQEIEITASQTQKMYGESDGIIDFKITKGELKFKDEFKGRLGREEGEIPGIYKITQGTLSINKNYNIIFNTNDFMITKRIIEIVPMTLSKIYGEVEPTIDYKVIGNLVFEDTLQGGLSREIKINPLNGREDVGQYLVFSSLNNENYIINMKQYYFNILPRDIVIKANDIDIIYGEIDPELTYNVVSGEIFAEDHFTGNISRIPGNHVGEYEIVRNVLNLGKNYNIIFQKGTFRINPIEIEIKCPNYEKIYGQIDPIFEYEIISGSFINNDQLRGNISREKGEDVGTYKLVNSLYNINYHIIMNETYITINPKSVYLITSVYDKVYDGNDIAHLKNPYVSGLIDEKVTLKYDKENCARFETIEVKNNIKVFIYNVELYGEKANNYHLVIPNDVYASITNKQIINGDISVHANDKAVLYDGYNLKTDVSTVKEEKFKIGKHKSIATYNIEILDKDKVISVDDVVTVKILPQKDIIENNNIYVYQKNEDGEYKLVSSYVNEKGELVIKASELGQFYITTDNDSWITYTAYISAGLIGLSACIVIVSYIYRKKKRRMM